MEYLDLEIYNLRGIRSLKAEINLSPGVYAITGQNASGKSTLMASLASIFYRELPRKFFVTTEKNTEIRVRKGSQSLRIVPKTPSWWEYEGNLQLNGFYEGSIIYGNRFRDTNLRALFEAQKITEDELERADDFVWMHLGKILHNNEKFYEGKLFRLVRAKAYLKYRFRGSPYFYKAENGNLISQLNLSTGENLLVSVLHSLNYQLHRRPSQSTYLVLLDEVELALHPSALNRLVDFLRTISNEKNLAVYFSTHSIELIRQIPPENLYFLKRHLDNTVEVQNPVSPAYATRAIYIHDGYDVLILVEDTLAKKIVERVIWKERLGERKLLHVVAAGGWENVLALHDDIVSSNLVKQGQRVMSVLDGDVEASFKQRFASKNKYTRLNVFFLPIRSAEKYLRAKLVEEVDYHFYNEFNDFFFRRVSLDELLQRYSEMGGLDGDKSGKKLLHVLKEELREIGWTEREFYTFLSEYIVEQEEENMKILADRIRKIAQW